MNVIVIGGGAAGFFGAIRAAERGHTVQILEAGQRVLAKVQISGGGRCNVTHACFEPRDLIQNYPRGGRELRGPFTRFQPQDTVQWFSQRGVALHTEADGRMFPTTNDATTVVRCLEESAAAAGVQVQCGQAVRQLQRAAGTIVVSTQDKTWKADAVLIATGGSPRGHQLAQLVGHTIAPAVPSLFTFHVQDDRLHELAGISLSAQCQLELPLPRPQRTQQDQLLITHQGFSGPAILKLSSWAARALHEVDYQAELIIDWLPEHASPDVEHALQAFRSEGSKRQLGSHCPLNLPRRLWRNLVASITSPERRWADLSNKIAGQICRELKAGRFQVNGKSPFKEEFVTCGGVELAEVDLRTMQSRRMPGLFFAGEILNVDALTGGFNFQNAWTTGWIAGSSMGDC